MKRYILHTLTCATIFGALLFSTSCSNDLKDMQPGEVRLQENDYRNDDKIQDVQVINDTDTINITALEIRSIWHAIILDAEKYFEYTAPEQKQTYENTTVAQSHFYKQLQFSILKFQNSYPASHQVIMDELIRADVHVYIEYAWCQQTKKYVDMKFLARPNITEEVPENIEN